MLFKRKKDKIKDKFEVKITGRIAKGNIDINASETELLLSLEILVQNMKDELNISEYDIRQSVNKGLYEDKIEFNTKK